MNKQLIVLYVMDALRPDHLGCYGYDRSTSECIDKLAEGGVVFENIYAQSTETKASAATIHTATYPAVHQTIAHQDKLPNGLVTLAETLKLSGFTTAAFNTNFRLSSEYGFNQGFDYYFDLHAQEPYINLTNLPSSEYLTKRVFSWLDSIRSKKIFVLVWSMDTHIPYAPPKEFVSRFIPDVGRVPDGTAGAIFSAQKQSDYQVLIDLYDAEIAHNDYQIEKFIHGLKARRKWDHTTFILTADHGEMFLEHGHFMIHGGAPYQEVTHVPMLIKSPDLIPGRTGSLGGLIDLMPTILQIADIAIPDKIQGHSLLVERPESILLAESYQEHGGYSLAVFNSDWKLIQSVGFIKHQLIGKLVRLVTNRKKDKSRKKLKYDVMNKGISPLLIKKALLKRKKNDFIGMPPVWQKDCSIFLWGKLIYKHFLGDERLELYNRRQDLFEQINLAALEYSQVQLMKDTLEDFSIKNKNFKKDLEISHRQISTDDELMQERLRQLGYIE